MKTGAELIAQERIRQIREEGWTSEHDAEHPAGCLAKAGSSYALDVIATLSEEIEQRRDYRSSAYRYWPFGAEWWKPTPNALIRQLVKAGALIAAEIDKQFQSTERR